jgi:sporulation protein YlmC with PRC-barrel domain
MSVRVSSLMGMDVFTDTAKNVGKVYDIIIDLQKGEVVRLTLEPIKIASKDDARRIFKEKTILYKSVKAVEKIIIVSSIQPLENEAVEEEPAKEPDKPFQHYSYKYRR